MLQRVLSPVLAGRQEELSQLEDALLSANRAAGGLRTGGRLRRRRRGGDGAFLAAGVYADQGSA